MYNGSIHVAQCAYSRAAATCIIPTCIIPTSCTWSAACITGLCMLLLLSSVHIQQHVYSHYTCSSNTYDRIIQIQHHAHDQQQQQHVWATLLRMISCSCSNIYIYIYIYIYTYTYIYIYIYIYSCSNIYKLNPGTPNFHEVPVDLGHVTHLNLHTCVVSHTWTSHVTR